MQETGERLAHEAAMAKAALKATLEDSTSQPQQPTAGTWQMLQPQTPPAARTQHALSPGVAREEEPALKTLASSGAAQPLSVGAEQGISGPAPSPAPTSTQTTPDLTSSHKQHTEAREEEVQGGGVDQERQGGAPGVSETIGGQAAPEEVEKQGEEGAEVKRGTVQAGEEAKEAVKQVEGAAGAATETVKSKAGQVTEAASQRLQEISKAGKVAVGIPEDKPISQAAKEAVDTIKETVAHVTETARDVASQAAQQAKHVAEELTHKLSDQTEGAKHKLQEGAQAVKETVVHVPERVREVHAHGLKLAEEKDKAMEGARERPTGAGGAAGGSQEMNKMKGGTEGRVGEGREVSGAGWGKLEQPDVSKEYYQAGISKAKEEEAMHEHEHPQHHAGQGQDAASAAGSDVLTAHDASTGEPVAKPSSS